MIWEVIQRTITGQYLRPYHKVTFEFTILNLAHNKGERPVIPEVTPDSFKQLITTCWNVDYTKRPNATKLLDMIYNIHKEYNQNREEWDKICNYTIMNGNQ